MREAPKEEGEVQEGVEWGAGGVGNECEMREKPRVLVIWGRQEGGCEMDVSVCQHSV